MLFKKGTGVLKKGILVIAASVAVSACSDIDHAENEAQAAAATAEVERVLANAEIVINAPTELPELLRLIREKSSHPLASHPSSCHLIPVGTKSCGGPERFVLVSSEQADVELVTMLAERYTRIQQEQMQNTEMSNCQILEPPEVTVAAGMCVPLRSERY